MKNYGIVEHGCFVVQIYSSGRGEGRTFKSWRNSFRWFRNMLSITGVSGGAIIFSDGQGNYRRIVRSIAGVLIWE